MSTVNPHVLQVEREKTMPVLVRFLCALDGGCWVVGSRADFRRPERITPTSDWDLLVPFASWEATAQAILAFKESDDVRDLRPTRYGGWRFAVPDKHHSTPNVSCTALVDVFAGDIGAWLLKPHTLAAWHPKSGTIVEKPLGEQESVRGTL